jgi:hypothetical protein
MECVQLLVKFTYSIVVVERRKSNLGTCHMFLTHRRWKVS